MKRLGLVVAVLVLAVVFYRPATGQDNHEERISGLETRVTALEAKTGNDASETPATPDAAEGNVLTITVRLVGRDYIVQDLGNGECRGTDQFHFRGLAAGASLDLLDEGDDVIATATIDAAALSTSGELLTCQLTITTTTLPDRDLYQLQLGPVGELVWTRTDLEAAGWHVEQTIE